MNLKRMDLILLSFGLLLIAVSSSQLFFQARGFEQGALVGKLTSTLAVVKTKTARALDWNDAVPGADLVEDQLIYTDKKSSAGIAFAAGGALEIDENSLVRIRSTKNERSLNLEKGFIRAKLSPNSPLTVKLNGKDYVLSGADADVQINLKEQAGEIGVLRGEVAVSSDGVSEKLSSKSALQIQADKVQKRPITFEALAPLRSETFYTTEATRSTAFRWSPEEAARVLLSATPSFKNARELSGAGALEEALAPGHYYWKVIGAAGESIVNSFSVEAETKPVALRPLSGETVQVREGERTQLLLQWEGSSAGRYALQWEAGEVHEKVVTGTNALVDLTAGPSFKWRVRLDSEERPLALWSDWQDLAVDFVPVPALPTDLSPHEFEFVSYKGPVETVPLSWKSQGPVDLEVKDPAGGAEVRALDGQTFEFTSKLAGRHQWRLRGVDKTGRGGEWTDWKTFDVTDLSSEKDPAGYQRIQLQKPDQAVTFAWENASGGVSVFELSKDKDFKEIVSKEDSRADSARVVVPKTGVYYWRSRQLLPDGTINVGEPKKVIIEPSPAPLKPEKLPDLEVPLKWSAPKSTRSLWDFFIAPAHAEDEESAADITLPKNENAKRYVIRIYRDAALTDLALETETESETFAWVGARAGTYHWQYAIVDHWNRRSEFSDPAVLRVKEDQTAAEKPKLLAPIRALEVDPSELVFDWSPSPANKEYEVSISADPEFKTVLHRARVREDELKVRDLALAAGLYYWKVVAYSRDKQSAGSNTGRFTVRAPEKPPLERIVVADPPRALPWEKVWRDRGALLWSPSRDTYEFTGEGTEGKISGNVLNSITVGATKFFDRYVLSADLRRASGKVYESKSYLFQKLSVDLGRSWDLGPRQKVAAGLSLGFQSTSSFEVSAGAPKDKQESGPGVGIALRHYLAVDPQWESQAKLSYTAGDVSELDATLEALRHFESFFLVAGPGFSHRNVKLGSGKATALRLSLGLGKEF